MMRYLVLEKKQNIEKHTGHVLLARRQAIVEGQLQMIVGGSTGLLSQK